MVDYDVIIVGGGAAGLTAAVYTCRKQFKTLVVSIDIGGQTNLTNHIENYPGVDAMPGPQLMSKFKENAETFGAEFMTAKLMKVNKNEDNTFTLELSTGDTKTCKAVILAYGKVPRKLGIPGEEQFFGRGLSTCVTCDAPLFKNKRVAVIGGGNSAVEGTIELAGLASDVSIVHRRTQYRADEITVEKLKNNEKINELLEYIPVEIKGDKFVTGLVVENVKTKERKEIEIDGVFSEIGFESDASAVAHLVKLTPRNEVIIDEFGNTSEAGIFAAGDVTQTPYKQTIISAGQGATAALEAHKWLTGGKGSPIDW